MSHGLFNHFAEDGVGVFDIEWHVSSGPYLLIIAKFPSIESCTDFNVICILKFMEKGWKP